jgi:VIT1/CCC1 family predicted Fe2+/Mn2+ transporter
MSDTLSAHPETPHRSHRAAWLRAAVLGADDGLVSVSSIMLGVSAAHANSSIILTAGIAGLVAGAMSMAAGEYISVSSQKDSEKADILIESKSLNENPNEELSELTEIYIQRGLDKKLAKQVAIQLHDHDALEAHLRDEIGIDSEDLSNPIQALLASAIAFSLGAIIPILAALIFKGSKSELAIIISTLVALGISGAAGAFLGGGNKLWAAARVFLGGGIAMAVTSLIGHLIGRSV